MKTNKKILIEELAKIDSDFLKEDIEECFTDEILGPILNAVTLAMDKAIAEHEASKWIKIEDRLPELGQRFNAVIHGVVEYNCYAYIGYWNEKDRRETMIIKGITHWMPLLKLPEPYQLEKVENKPMSDELKSQIQDATDFINKPE